MAYLAQGETCMPNEKACFLGAENMVFAQPSVYGLLSYFFDRGNLFFSMVIVEVVHWGQAYLYGLSKL